MSTKSKTILSTCFIVGLCAVSLFSSIGEERWGTESTSEFAEGVLLAVSGIVYGVCLVTFFYFLDRED
jgi:ABC-type Fe3+ transport system permease subunit